MDTEIAAALIQGAFTLAAGGAAIWGISYQIRKQGEQSREAILEGEARKLKMQMYEEGITAARDLADATIALSVRLQTIHSALKSREHMILEEIDLPWFDPKTDEISSLIDTFSEQCIKFVYLLENRRIIDSRMIIFRDMLHALKHDADQHYHDHLMCPLVIMSFRTNYQNNLYDMRDMEQKATPFLEIVIYRLFAIVWLMEDFSVEMQNLLLGDSLNNKVPHRVPIDPHSLVVKLDDYEALQAHIQQTPWGKKNARIEAETAASFLKPNSPS